MVRSGPRGTSMRRRQFITLLGGAAAWPLTARAQQPAVRRIGVLMLYPENDPEGQLRATAFRQGLNKLGWTAGRNIQIDFHWGLGDTDWIRSAAAQLLQLGPEVILANGDAAARTVQQSIRTVPVIFIAGSDPVGTASTFGVPGVVARAVASGKRVRISRRNPSSVSTLAAILAIWARSARRRRCGLFCGSFRIRSRPRRNS